MTNNKYTWLPFFEELLGQICIEYNPETLYKVWHQIFPDKYNDINKMDPFSLIGKITSFSDEKLYTYCDDLKRIFNLKSDLPTDFIGIPRIDRRNPMFRTEIQRDVCGFRGQ